MLHDVDEVDRCPQHKQQQIISMSALSKICTYTNDTGDKYQCIQQECIPPPRQAIISKWENLDYHLYPEDYPGHSQNLI